MVNQNQLKIRFFLSSPRIMSFPKLIGLAGKKGVGKSTLASALVCNLDGEEYSFALPLKRAVREIFHFTDAQLGFVSYGCKDKEEKDSFWNVSPRQIMQVVGTELFRDKLAELFPDNDRFSNGHIWISAFERWYNERKDNTVIVSDVRFANEASAIRAMGGEVWLIERPSVKSTDSHASEKIDFPVDRVIVNDFSTAKEFVSSIINTRRVITPASLGNRLNSCHFTVEPDGTLVADILATERISCKGKVEEIVLSRTLNESWIFFRESEGAPINARHMPNKGWHRRIAHSHVYMEGEDIVIQV